MNELDKWQTNTTLPGMWPAMVNSAIYNESVVLGSPWPGGDEQFTLGALADSTYEYLPKVSTRYTDSEISINVGSNTCYLADK